VHIGVCFVLERSRAQLHSPPALPVDSGRRFLLTDQWTRSMTNPQKKGGQTGRGGGVRTSRPSTNNNEVVGSDFSRRLPPRRQATHQQQSLNYENFLRSDAIDGPEQSEESPPPVKRPPKRVRRTAAKVPVENPDHNQLFTDDEFSDVLRTIRRHGTVE
jgi:hypothetical protein